MILVHLQGKAFDITVIQVYAQLTYVEDTEVGWFHEGLQNLLEPTPKKQRDVLFIIEDWNANVGSKEIPGVTGKFDLGVKNEVRQWLTEFC